VRLNNFKRFDPEWPDQQRWHSGQSAESWWQVWGFEPGRRWNRRQNIFKRTKKWLAY